MAVSETREEFAIDLPLSKPVAEIGGLSKYLLILRHPPISLHTANRTLAICHCLFRISSRKNLACANSGLPVAGRSFLVFRRKTG
jgi:hypothetical protein